MNLYHKKWENFKKGNHFQTLANFYIQHLKKLDKYGYYEHILNYCHAVDTTGVKKWLRIKTQIKEEELFKQTLDQMR